MKKKPDVSAKARSGTGWHKHLRPEGKRRAWKSNRRLVKTALVADVDNLPV